MKIISWNVNGLRSVNKKGFLNFLKKEKPDILCLQEIKIQEGDIPEELTAVKGYNIFYNFAAKKGYSGLAVFSRQKPEKLSFKFGMEKFDEEGRFAGLDFSDLTLIVLYMPHGGRGEEKLEYITQGIRFSFKTLKKSEK